MFSNSSEYRGDDNEEENIVRALHTDSFTSCHIPRYLQIWLVCLFVGLYQLTNQFRTSRDSREGLWTERTQKLLDFHNFEILQ